MDKKIQGADKKKAWAEFSRFVRVRDCLLTTGMPFSGRCITCERQFHISYLQAGHCIPGRTNAKLFDKELVFAQCAYCNIIKHGEKKKYEAKMIERYGEKGFEEKIIAAKQIIPNMDFKAITEEYKLKYKKLMEKYGYKTYRELLQMGR